MSLWNPWAPSFGWKIDPDRRQDRSCGKVTTRQMTEEEMKKYGIVKGEDEDMLKINHKELLDVCREHGTGKDGYKAVAEKFNITEKQAENQIFNQKIRRKLEAEKMEKKTAAAEDSKEPIPENTSQEGPLPETTEETRDNNGQPEVINNAEASDRMEPEVYPDLKEVVSDLASKMDCEVKNLPDLTPDPESVNHPAHYTAGGIETIDYIQDKLTPEKFEGFCVGNALKYLSRYEHKGGLEDLRKARWYLNRIISVKESVSI
jgi:hypothetical protein